MNFAHVTDENRQGTRRTVFDSANVSHMDCQSDFFSVIAQKPPQVGIIGHT